jgi:hypothetical protein
MADNLADLDCQVPPGSRAAGVAISRTRWHDEGDIAGLSVSRIRRATSFPCRTDFGLPLKAR